jgi:hypothetical protein
LHVQVPPFAFATCHSDFLSQHSASNEKIQIFLQTMIGAIQTSIPANFSLKNLKRAVANPESRVKLSFHIQCDRNVLNGHSATLVDLGKYLVPLFK